MAKFMACYMGTPPADGARPSPETIAAGMAAWHRWMEDHAAAIVDTGGPLGKTRRVGPDGISVTRNALTGYVVIEADSHDAAAAMFSGHPHFSIFPGDCVEVIEILPIPGA